MSFPVVPVVAAVGAGLGLKWLWDHFGPASGKNPLMGPGEVTSYKQGKTYTLRVTTKFEPGQVTGLGAGGADARSTAQRLLGTALTQWGFEVLSPPVLRDIGNEKAFYAGQEAEWIANAKWTRADLSSITVSPPIVKVRGTLQPTL